MACRSLFSRLCYGYELELVFTCWLEAMNIFRNYGLSLHHTGFSQFESQFNMSTLWEAEFLKNCWNYKEA